MLHHLPESIVAFSTQSRKTVSSLIQSVKSDKAQVSMLVENLRAFDLNANYSPSLALRYSGLEIEGVIEFFRDSSLRVGQLFSAASALSSILNSLVSVYSSEIEKIEKDIFHLENFINNYQFIVGEDDLFNFNYVENFDNDLSSHLSESFNIALTDRDGINFSNNGNYHVDTVLSKMSTSSGINFTNQISNIKDIKISTNYAEFATTATDFKDLMNESLLDNWSVTVKSPYILTSQLSDAAKYISYDSSYIMGAKSLVEIEFVIPVEMDVIRITPNDSIGLQLLQVVLFKTDPIPSTGTISVQTEYIDYPVLNAPLLLDKSVDVLFNKSKVSKIKFIFNQSKYIRTENTPIIGESNSKMLHKVVADRRKSKKNEYSKLQDLVYFYFKNANDISKNRKNAKAYTEVYSYRYPSIEEDYSNDVIKDLSEMREDQAISRATERIDEKNSSPIENYVQGIVQHVIGSRNNLFNIKTYRTVTPTNDGNRLYNLNSDGFIPLKDESNNFDNSFQKQDPNAPGVTLFDVSKYLLNRETPNAYEYAFSLRNISFGIFSSSTQSKSCFVSKVIETDGSPLGVKGLVNKIKERKNLLVNNYELREPGSYELSISYVDTPSSEEDWIPIHANASNYIDSEVLFFNTNNFAKLRFNPKEPTIKVYKDGKLENPNSWSYTEAGNGITYNSSVDSGSIYVAEYYLNNIDYNPSIVDLDSIRGSTFSVKAFSDAGKPAEAFSSTGPANKVVLSFKPLIENKFTNAYYSQTYGTINTEENIGYSPVIVTLSNGQTAINLTNYTSNNFIKGSFYSTDEYLFFQNGKELIFNKPINSSFTVSYSFIPSSLRFRVITRNNIPGQFNGISIDNVIIKCKVKNLDTFSEKLLRL